MSTLEESMSERPLREDGNLGVCLAAWMVTLAGRGVLPTDPALASKVSAVHDEATGKALAGELRDRLADIDVATVLDFVRKEYGDNVSGDLGAGTREESVRRVRRYQFTGNRPWLCRLYERYAGVVQPTWVLVGRLTDEVLMLDPDPYDGIEEERTMPLTDFMVLWDLDGRGSVAYGPC